MNDSMITLR